MPKARPGDWILLTRTITDGGTEFDRMCQGYTGPLYAEICPRSFSVLVRPGHAPEPDSLSRRHAVLSDRPSRAARHTPLVIGEAVIRDGLGFSVDLSCQAHDLVGYRAKPHTGVIDLDKLRHYDPADYWEEVRRTDGQIILDPGRFTFWSAGSGHNSTRTMPLKWPPIWRWLVSFACITRGFLTLASAMPRPMGRAARGVLEVRCHEAPLSWSMGKLWDAWSMRQCLKHPASCMVASIASNYQGQGLKLSKHFK